MVGRWPDRIGLYGILLFNLIICPFVCCDCWESCFVPSERNEFTVEYEKIFQVVTTFRQAMTTDANTGSGTSNGTVFLMDTTMPTGTDDSTGYFSYTIQKRLAQILAFTLPITSSFNPGFFVHYDGKHSWTCDDWKCLGRCDMYLALESEFQDYTTTDDIDLMTLVNSRHWRQLQVLVTGQPIIFLPLLLQIVLIKQEPRKNEVI